jgi:hypothetical protein
MPLHKVEQFVKTGGILMFSEKIEPEDEEEEK